MSKFDYSKPCLTPEVSPFSGRTFIRDWPKVCPCPGCGSTFYARRLESEYPARHHQVDPEPALLTHGSFTISAGMRDTCGHPQCHEWEIKHQAERSPDWWKAQDKAFPAQGETNPTINKPKGLKRFGS